MASLIDKHGNVAFFGRLSWGNFVDWLVTLCLGLIVCLMTLSLGGVRPETHLALLPLFVFLLVLHGLWLALDKESPKRLSQVPLWFCPALLLVILSAFNLSLVPWRGHYEAILAIELFILFWVMVNNVRSRAHLWLLILTSLVPSCVAVFNGFYQFFQKPDRMVSGLSDLPLELNSEFLGRAMGSFADPNSFGAFLLILLPSFLIAACVARLPVILRIFSFYVALMLLASIALTQAYWAIVLSGVVLGLVPWFCFRRFKRRVVFSLCGILAAAAVFVGMALFHSGFESGVGRALTADGEGVRFVLWQEALQMTSERPILGSGAGSFGAIFEQSDRVALGDVALTPHNDYLLLLSQYGGVGALLVLLPFLYVLMVAWARWRKEPFAAKVRDSDKMIMPPQRFFLSIGLAGVCVFCLCLGVTFVFYVPAIAIYGLIAFSIIVKAGFACKVRIPESAHMRLLYPVIALVVGFQFYAFSFNRLEASALELQASQKLEHVIEMRVHVSGNTRLLLSVIELYEDALLIDPENADAWLGLSASICQLYYQDPSGFREIAFRAIDSAEKALAISPDYWKVWAQLGVAQSFDGELESAEISFLRALELAPNNSNAHYYYAAYLGADRDRREEAIRLVRRALDINPRNAAARRLEQKLLIL